MKPSTSSLEVTSLLSKYLSPPRALIDSVNLLAVEPGVGGQPFQKTVLPKVHAIREVYTCCMPHCVCLSLTTFLHLLASLKSLYTHLSPCNAFKAYPALQYLAVDGGINEHTGRLAVAAGANVLVAGSSIFGNGATYSTIEETRKRGPVRVNAYRKLLSIFRQDGVGGV